MSTRKDATFNYPYLTYGWQQDASPVDSSEVPHTDDCDESILAQWSAGLLGVAMQRYACEALGVAKYPIECIQSIVKLLYLTLWTDYILCDARLHDWRLMRVDGRGRELKVKRLSPPPSFACRGAITPTVFIWDRHEGEMLLAQNLLFCTSLRRRGVLNSRNNRKDNDGVYAVRRKGGALPALLKSPSDESAASTTESPRAWNDCLCRIS